MRAFRRALPWVLIAVAAALAGWRPSPAGAGTRVAAQNGADGRGTGMANVKSGEAEPASDVITGRVVTPDGRPVGGALVNWVGRVEEETRVLVSVMTDGEGRFRVERVSQLRDKGAPLVTVEAEGWGLTFHEVPEETKVLDIALVPATEARVRFLGPNGEPVPDLKVVPIFLRGERLTGFLLTRDVRDHLTRRTDARGIAAFAGLGQGYRLRLDVEDERFAHLTFGDVVELGRSAVTEAKPIHLLPGASVRGRVTFGPSGEPAVGVRVGAQGVPDSEGGGFTVTDADGGYVLTQLRPGAYNVALGLRGETARDWTGRAHEKFSVGPAEHRDGIDFTLIKGAVITGRVFAEGTGKPIAGKLVAVYGPAHPRSGAWVQNTLSGPDGVYLLRVPAGEQYVYFQDLPPPGFIKPAKEAHEITIRDGETVTIDFPLRGGASVRPVQGRVVGPDGRSTAGAEVVLTAPGWGPDEAPRIRADETGAFTLSEKRLIQPLTLRARLGGLATGKGIAVTGGEQVTLRLEPNVLVTLSGSVVDAAGKPVRGAEVSLAAWTYDTGHGAGRTTSDTRGRYSFPGLWPDLRYTVHATNAGYGKRYSEPIDPRPGESRTLEPLVLETADRILAGRVITVTGEPVAGERVQLHGRATKQQSTTTDREGRFRFDEVVNEEVTLLVAVSRHQVARQRVKAGRTDVVVTLPGEEGLGGDEVAEVLNEPFDQLVGRDAPPLQTSAWIHSPPRTLQQFRGQVVLIDFWSTGCGPCVAVLPGIQRVADQFSGKGGVVIGLHNAGLPRAELQAFAEARKLTFPMAVDASEEEPSPGKTFRQYLVRGIPTVAVIDRSGKVAYLGHSLDAAVSTFGALLGQTPRDGEERAR